MHELTEQELYHAFSFARSLDEAQGKQILATLSVDQPALYQTLFGLFPAIIAEHHEDMAYLFMDLCFDVVCVFQQVFGDPPQRTDDPVWLEKQGILLDADLQALIQGRVKDEKTFRAVIERFSASSASGIAQVAMIKVLNEAIDEHAAEKSSRIPAINITQMLMFVVVKLLCNLYNTPTHH